MEHINEIKDDIEALKIAVEEIRDALVQKKAIRIERTRVVSGDTKERMFAMEEQLKEFCSNFGAVGCNSIRANKFYEKYLEWAKFHDEHIISKTHFGIIMSSIFTRVRLSSGIHYMDVPQGLLNKVVDNTLKW